MSYGETEKRLDWELFTQTHEKALELLQRKLNPESLEDIEKPNVAL